MEDFKGALTSKTIWGAIIAIIGAILSAFHLDSGALAGSDGEIVTLIGSVLAIIGRIKAVKKIG